MSGERARERDELIAALLGPAGAEITCEECFEQLDRYVDLTLAGGDRDGAVPGMRAHLTGCPACREDHDSLLELAGGGYASPPAA
ncbi:MAG: hypothetical protein QOJ89_1003 [bacterium]|jgi:hypothetical protein